MKQLNKTQIIIYHLYPGACIVAGFILLSPLSIRFGFPPQFGLLLSVLFIALPVLLLHLRQVKIREGLSKLSSVNQLRGHQSLTRLILYALGLTIVSFLIWGLTQPLDHLISAHLLHWLPGWFSIQSFAGFAASKIRLTLFLNLLLNGLAAPLAEEFYFRGYLLPRMQQAYGRYAFLVNTVLFSLYHFWQPGQYATLILALMPTIWLVSKTRSLRLAVMTHMLMNLVGALLAFASISAH